MQPDSPGIEITCRFHRCFKKYVDKCDNELLVHFLQIKNSDAN